VEYAELLCVLTVGPDANSAMDGIHRLLRDIVNHAVEPKEIGERAAARLNRFEQSKVRRWV
jgi:hypothetical protein